MSRPAASLDPASAPDGPVDVLLADAQVDLRREMRACILADPSFRVLAEESSAVTAVARTLKRRPALCVIAADLPGGGLAATWEIASCLRQTQVVLIVDVLDERQFLNAVRVGARGYLPRSVGAGLPRALHAVAVGEPAIPRELLSQVFALLKDSSARRRVVFEDSVSPHLTSREWQVADLLARGLSTSEIAERLSVSRETIRSHVAGIMRKLRAPDRATAVRALVGARALDQVAP